MSRNPYHASDGTPKLRNSVFVFMDILGYREMIEASEKDGTSQNFLIKLHKILADARLDLEEKNPGIVEFNEGCLPKDNFALKAFTDNIVIGWPIRYDANVEIGLALAKLAEFQLSMAIEGFFVRGAVSVGSAYIDEIAVWGDALNQAYDGETKLAIDPRIILMPTMVDVAKRHFKYHASDLLCDSDGQWFINYLAYLVSEVELCGPLCDEALKHKASVEKNLLNYKSNPRVFSKYAWVAKYHNFFCDGHKEHFPDEYRIDVALFREGPRPIDDE